MSFYFAFSPQPHKARNGYFLNHDNLMIATPEERKKLIFYFVANQTPEKLNPDDREKFLAQKFNSIDVKGYLCSLAMGYTAMRKLGWYRSSLNPRYLYNLSAAFAVSTLVYYLGNSLAYAVLEPKFVARDQLVDELSKKYNFTIFDFQQSKKDSHLKELRNELTSESASPIY